MFQVEVCAAADKTNSRLEDRTATRERRFIDLHLNLGISFQQDTSCGRAPMQLYDLNDSCTLDDRPRVEDAQRRAFARFLLPGFGESLGVTGRGGFYSVS